MKAAVYHGQKDLRIRAMPEPDRAGPGEVVVAVLRAAICGTDVTEYLHGPHFTPLERPHPASGHAGPMIIGHEFVGRVIDVGPNVDGLAVGQRIVPGAGAWCGDCEWCRAGRTNLCAHYYTRGLNQHGGLAELARVPAMMAQVVPDAVDDDAAAMAQPLAVAMHAAGRSQAQPGQTVALLGVGGIGSFILASLVAQGLGPIAVIDIDVDRLDRAAVLGAHHLINAHEEDPVAAVRRLTGGEGAHVFIEASGAPPGPALALDGTRRGGHVLIVGMQAAPQPFDFHAMAFREINVSSTVAHVCDHDLPRALAVLANSDLAARALDRIIPLDALVEEGIMALHDGRAKGKIVVDPRG